MNRGIFSRRTVWKPATCELFRAADGCPGVGKVQYEVIAGHAHADLFHAAKAVWPQVDYIVDERAHIGKVCNPVMAGVLREKEGVLTCPTGHAIVPDAPV